MDCPCGSGKTYDECCEPFIRGKAFPETAEQLMRSRYSAYTLQEIPYITDTLHPDHREDWDERGPGTGRETPFGRDWKSFIPKGAALGMRREQSNLSPVSPSRTPLLSTTNERFLKGRTAAGISRTASW